MGPASLLLVWRRREIRLLFAASLVGRMPGTMLGLALVLVVAGETGSYARAGLCVAAWTLGSALTTVPLARAVDRLGRTPVLLASGVANALSTLALAVLPAASLPFALLAAVVGATSPPLPSASRSLWPELLDGAGLAALYVVDAIAVELTYIAGPGLVALLTAALDPRAAVAACALLALVGGGAFALSGTVRAAGAGARAGATGSALLPALWRLLAVGLALTSGLGVAEVAVVAAARGAGHSSLAGVLVCVWSAGGIMAGVLAGARASRIEGRDPLSLLVWLAAAGLGLLALAPSLALLAPLLFLAGGAITPAMACLSALVGARAPHGRRTEAFGLMATVFVLGGALGAALGGIVAGAHGPGFAFLAAAAATLPGAVLAARSPAPAPLAAPAATAASEGR